MSDILYWVAPTLVGYIHRIEKYIKTSVLKTEARRESLAKLMPDLGGECSEEDMLRIPQVFLEETLTSEIKASIKYSKNKNTNKEADSLKRFVEIYESLIEKYKCEASMTSE